MAKSVNTALKAKATKIAIALEGNFFSFKEGVVYKVIAIDEAKGDKPATFTFEFDGAKKVVEARYVLPFLMKSDFTDFATDRVFPIDEDGNDITTVANDTLLNKDGFTVTWEEGEYVGIKKLAEDAEDCDNMVTVGDNRYKCRPAKRPKFICA